MWKAIEYSEEYLDRMLEMVKENYGDTEIANEAFIKWQYFDNPAGKAVINFAYNEEADELAGQYICVPLKTKMYDKELIAAYALDILTRESYRGQRIFTELGKVNYKICQERKFDYKIIFPNSNSRPGYIKNFKFKSVCRFPILVSPIKILHVSPKKKEKNIVEITENNIMLFDKFWPHIKDKYNILGVRNAEYMKWRYLDVPLREYKFYGLIKENRLLGYIVGTIKNISGIRTGVITDMLLGSNCGNEEVRELINALIKFFNDKNARVSMAFFPKHGEEYKILKRNFYFKWPKKFEPRIFEVLALDFEGNNLLNIFDAYEKENWFTTMGDYLLV